MPTLPNCSRTLEVGVDAVYDRHGPILLGAAAGDSLVPRVQDGVGGVVSGSLLPVPEQEVLSPSIGYTVSHIGPKAIYGILP